MLGWSDQEFNAKRNYLVGVVKYYLREGAVVEAESILARVCWGVVESHLDWVRIERWRKKHDWPRFLAFKVFWCSSVK